jgi:hypothetical protein
MRKFNAASDMNATALLAVTTGYKTHLIGYAATTNLRRGRTVEIAVGPVSNPVTQDCNILYAVQRSTTAGTSALAITPAWVGVQEAGSDTPVPGSVWGNQLSAEPTITANSRLWTKALNQHSGFIWYSPDEMGLPWPAVNLNGLAYQTKGATSDYTGTVLWEAKFEE